MSEHTQPSRADVESAESSEQPKQTEYVERSGNSASGDGGGNTPSHSEDTYQ